ncbi:MAG: hypothetical protein QM680_06130 [Luteolibacter sp.]
MKRFSLKHAFACFKAVSLATVAAIGLTACGGGGSSDEDVVAPESLDLTTLNFFDAFTMTCTRLNGTAGNETGAVEFSRTLSSFFLGVASGSSAVGRYIQLPSVLTSVKYTYERTGTNTGRITFTWTNSQESPWYDGLSSDDDQLDTVYRGYMFWNSGVSSADETSLVVDVLFEASGGYLINNTARIRSAYYYDYSGTSNPYTLVVTPVAFDASDVSNTSSKVLTITSTTTGTYLQSGYNPYKTMTDSTPSSAVWTSMDDRTVALTTGSLVLTGGFVSSSATGPSLQGGTTVEDHGLVLIDTVGDSAGDVEGVQGTYSYGRSGSDIAKLSIQYKNGAGTTVTLKYTMDFESLNDGNLTESTTNSSGTFVEDTTETNAGS